MLSQLQILEEFQPPPDTCPYVPAEQSSLNYRLIAEVDESDFVELLRRGWRRHGMAFFRPRCPSCTKCQSLRLPLDRFRLSKSQRRARNRNSDVSWEVDEIKISPEHIDLFNRYHLDMHQRRQWPMRVSSPADYYESFVLGNWSFAREMQFRNREGRLIGVSLMDVVEQVGSSIYFYHDPDLRSAALGTYSLLQEIAYLQSINATHHYLGYWIAECPSMAYKVKFGPHEILTEHCGDNEEPQWVEV